MPQVADYKKGFYYTETGRQVTRDDRYSPGNGHASAVLQGSNNRSRYPRRPARVPGYHTGATDRDSCLYRPASIQSRVRGAGAPAPAPYPYRGDSPGAQKRSAWAYLQYTRLCVIGYLESEESRAAVTLQQHGNRLVCRQPLDHGLELFRAFHRFVVDTENDITLTNTCF